MFSTIKQLPADPLLGLSRLFAEDKHAHKIDLGVGVYRTPEGRTPVMKAVSEAQARYLGQQTTKSYTPPESVPGFPEALQKLTFGAEHPALKDGRVTAIQTPGGCGALRVGAELLKRQKICRLMSGAPTWPNHQPLICATGITIEMVPYYDRARSRIDFDAFMGRVKTLGPEDALLLHGACHNPTGADLSAEEIGAVIDAAEAQGFLPFVDFAYHGFAKSLDEDAYLIREMARRLPELLVSYSCSKNFGLYRERTGGIIAMGATPAQAQAVRSHMLNIAREIYSMPPAHGGHIVAEILGSDELTRLWQEELAEMCKAVRANRTLLAATAHAMGLGTALDFVERQNGMFSLLPLDEAQVLELRGRYGIYLAGSGRTNICGINRDNVEYLCTAYRDVTGAGAQTKVRANG